MKTENKPDPKKKDEQQEHHPHGEHASQGHASGSDEAGTAEDSKEPTIRASTTDSSRVHKNANDDLPTGGNIR